MMEGRSYKKQKGEEKNIKNVMTSYFIFNG